MGRPKWKMGRDEAAERLDWVMLNRDPVEGPEEYVREMVKGLRLREVSWALGVSERTLREWQRSGRLPRGGYQGFIPARAVLDAVTEPEE
jgi:hypothetical protein